MPEPEYFPEVSNWERRDPEYESDTTDIWVNTTLEVRMRCRVVNGPFGVLTSSYVVELREFPSEEVEWESVADSPYDSKGAAQKAAYEYAEEHNE